MRFTKNNLFIFLNALALLFALGCAQKPNYLEQSSERDKEASLIISGALAAGKGVIITKDPRPSLWLAVDKDASFSLHQELPYINGYSIVAVEPGTYVYAGGKVSFDAGESGNMGPVDIQLDEEKDSLGTVRTIKKDKVRTWTEYANLTVPATYDLGFAYGRSSYGRSPYRRSGHRRDYWGDSYYHGRDMNYFGTSMNYPSTVTVRRPVAVHSESKAWFDTFTVVLPNKGLEGKSKKALVASIRVGPGEVVVLDQVFIKDLVGEAEKNTQIKSPDGQKVLKDSDSHDIIGPIKSLSIVLQPHSPDLAPLLPAFLKELREERRVEKGSWLLKKAETEESGIEIYTISR